MVDVPVSASRRKRPVSAASSGSRESGGLSFVSLAITLLLVAAAVTCLVIPNQVDEALDRTATVISENKAAAGETLASVISIATDAENDPVPSPASINVTTLKPGQNVVTGSEDHTVMTSGHDMLRLGPQSAIMVRGEEEKGPASVIELLYGTLRVKAAKRTDGEALSIETPALVATVKGTEFEVVALDHGTAVAVTEGLVSVRSTRSGEAIDVTPGHTAVVSAVHGVLPTMVATPPDGASGAIDAAVDGTLSNSNHHRR
jgi:hypothetical protein